MAPHRPDTVIAGEQTGQTQAQPRHPGRCGPEVTRRAARRVRCGSERQRAASQTSTTPSAPAPSRPRAPTDPIVSPARRGQRQRAAPVATLVSVLKLFASLVKLTFTPICAPSSAATSM